MLDRDRVELGGHERGQLLHALLALLPGEPEVAQADLAGLGHLGLRPDARVLARVHRDEQAVTEVDPLAAGHADHAVDGHTRLLHDPHGLVAADQPGAGAGGDALGAVQVVEVRVADHDPVALVDVGRRQPGPGGDGRPIDVGVEEHGQAVRPQPERRAAVPVERGAHRAPPHGQLLAVGRWYAWSTPP
ncbi:MAG: hypothetical protein ACXWB2_12670 [Acidimicrobiales bacterium]